MCPGAARSLLILVLSGLLADRVPAQTISIKPAPARTEPGLENAVKWEWRVAPSDDKDWGLPIAMPTPAPAIPVIAKPTPEIRPALYEVKRGDALILIAKRFGLTVAQLKVFNQLENDTIQVGQILKLPSLMETKTIVLPVKKQKAKAPLEPKIDPQMETLRLEIFLDREEFSAGPIVADPGPAFTKIMLLYESSHDDAKDDASLAAKAHARVEDVFTRYKLRAEDFRFIAPPRAETLELRPAPVNPHGRPAKHPSVKAVTPLDYQELTDQSMLAYRTPWEFVAERFHCQEGYLRALNEKLPSLPPVGTEFQVPNVIPFEIEKALDEPLQPQADPKTPVTASVIGLLQLNIYQGGALIAVMPISPARPGLHGRGSWTILDVIPRPRLATFQEERKATGQKTVRAFATPEPVQEPVPPPSRAALASEQYLAAGPKNPVGILWINLAKAKSTEPLPYGLHGTSIPDQMNRLESIGGFRMTNWDIARAVRHLPFGTPLDWK